MKKLTFGSLFAGILVFSTNASTAADDNRILNSDGQCGISTSTSSSNGYNAWLAGGVSSVEYENFLYLATKSDMCNGMAFHWNIVNNEKIQIAVAVKLQTIGSSLGWVGVGFSETGGMRGADIVYFESSSMTLTDAHVGDGYVKPTIDKVQDWTLLHGEKTSDGYLIFEAERDLIIEDANQEDQNIVNDSDVNVVDHKIIGAWGSDTTSISYHGRNVVQQSVQLFATDDSKAGDVHEIFKKDMERRADGHAFLKVDNYLIPTDETTYEYFCFTVQDLVDLGLYETVNSSTHIIGFEFVGGEDVRKYVHHMVVEGHFTDLNEGVDSCNEMTQLSIAAWAPGQDDLQFPEGMGLEIGNVAGSFNAITLQIHYDNIDGDENKIDNGTGVKIYYTNQPVEHEIGMAVMGDGLVILNRVPIGNGKTRHDITCPSSCTEEVFDDEEVTVILESHHMHAKGKRLVSSLFRPSDSNSDILVNKASTNYWDFDQNGLTAVRQEPFKWKRGEYFTTTCYFESYDDVTFGLSSSEEMCMTFIYYYPKQPRLYSCTPFFSLEESCMAKYSKTELESNSNFNREISRRFDVEPDPIDNEDRGDSNASATLPVHGVVLSIVLPVVIWLQN